MPFDKIKNPDVPGFEEFLPPPPPMPPPLMQPPPMQPPALPSVITVNPSESVGNSMSNIPHPNIPYGYPTPANQPWWIPSETDSAVYDQWYKTAYTAALQAAQEKDPVSGRPKPKYFKRKAEPIDAKADAEKVAHAQKELSALMKPLKCDLCNAVMNSTLQAKLHYQGKPHQKKVSMYLNQSAKKQKIEDDQVTSSTTNNDWNTYCDVCKIWFTSQVDATQHYAGKKHMKAAFGTTPAKALKKHADVKTAIDPTGRYGIGMGFQPEIHVPTPVPPESPALIIPPVPQYSHVPPVPYPTPLRCELCGISANRQDQLDTHKQGIKHLKMLKLHGLPATKDVIPTGPIDYSIYRTPSGQYYCSPCNVSITSEIMFGQHMESKKHKAQVNPKSTQPTPNSKKSKKVKSEK